MAKLGRPRKKAEKPSDTLALQPEQEPVEELTEERKELLFPAARGDDRIRVNRYDDYSKAPILHGYMMPGEDTEARVAELFGGGKYQCVHLVRNEKGQQVWKDSRTLTVLGPYKRPQEIYGMPKDASLTARVESGTATVHTIDPRIPSGVSPLEAMNNALVTRVLDLMESRGGRGNEKPTDWPPIVASVTTLIGTIITAMMTRKQGDPEVSAAVARLEAQLKQQPGPAASAIGDAVKAVKELIGVRDMLTGQENPGKEFDPMSLVPKLLDLIQSRSGAVPSPEPALLPSGEPVVVQPPRNLPMWQQLLIRFKPQLVDFARRGIAPDLAAGMALSYMPPELEGVIVEFVQREDAGALLVQTIPELVEFQQWVKGFLDAARAEVIEEPESEETE
jgi:hypothetical protein